MAESKQCAYLVEEALKLFVVTVRKSKHKQFPVSNLLAKINDNASDSLREDDFETNFVANLIEKEKNFKKVSLKQKEAERVDKIERRNERNERKAEKAEKRVLINSKKNILEKTFEKTEMTAEKPDVKVKKSKGVKKVRL